MVSDAKIKKLLLKAWLEKKPRMWLSNISLKLFTETLKDQKLSILRSRRLRAIDLLHREA